MLTLWEDSETFIVAGEDVPMRIDRYTGDISALTGAFPRMPKPSRSIVGILGVLMLPVSRYLIIATQAEEVEDLLNNRVYRVTKTEILPFRTQQHQNTTDAHLLKLAREHLNAATLYFSKTFDLTNALQRQQPVRGDKPLYANADTRFFWNYALTASIRDAAKSYPQLAAYVLLCIYGVYSVSFSSIFGVRAEFGVITRRSRFRAGTRYLRRGLDAHGHAANYNETEQLLVVNHRVFSFVQTRGSVPTFWGEINQLRYRPWLWLGAPATEAARKHFAFEKKIYGPQFLVNLVNQEGYEKGVKEAYETVVRELADPDLRYVYFDFHHECSRMRWHRVHILVEQLIEEGLDQQHWFELDQGKPTKQQFGTVRTNCMDCLDRTNVVQSCIAGWVLQRQLQAAGVISGDQNWEDDTAFLTLFRNVWADNANGVSSAYSGTGALKTDFTRTGKRTKKGAFQDLCNSARRYYLNNFCDGPRQDGYSVILGNYPSIDPRRAPFVDRRPVYVQSMPYICCSSAFLFLVSLISPNTERSSTFNFGVSVLFCAIFLGSFRYIVNNGLQYVNWPRLAPMDCVQLKPYSKYDIFVERKPNEKID